MINTFGCKETEKIFNRRPSKKFPHQIIRRARRKLELIDFASHLDDLRVPPSNGLHELNKEYKGYHAIKVNDQ